MTKIQLFQWKEVRRSFFANTSYLKSSKKNKGITSKKKKILQESTLKLLLSCGRTFRLSMNNEDRERAFGIRMIPIGVELFGFKKSLSTIIRF